MPIAVVLADRDESQARREAFIKHGTLVTRTVMSHLDHIHTPQFRQQPQLRLLAQVTKEDRPKAVQLGLDDNACRITGDFASTGRQPRRPQHLPTHLAQHTVITGTSRGDGGAGLAEPRAESFVCGAARRPVQNRIDTADDGIRSPNMVKIEVSEHENGDTRYAEGGEAVAQCFWRWPGIDEHHPVGALQHDRIALADITDRDLPV